MTLKHSHCSPSTTRLCHSLQVCFYWCELWSLFQTSHLCLTAEGAKQFARSMGVPEVPQESLITEYSRMRWRKNLAPDANPVECQMWDATLFKALFRKSCGPLEMSCCCTSLCKQLLQSLQTAITYEEQQSILSLSHQISWPRGVESVLLSGNKIGYTWGISSTKLFLKPLRLHI